MQKQGKYFEKNTTIKEKQKKNPNDFQLEKCLKFKSSFVNDFTWGKRISIYVTFSKAMQIAFLKFSFIITN